MHAIDLACSSLTGRTRLHSCVLDDVDFSIHIPIAHVSGHHVLHHRYGIRDIAGGGRSSARETIGRVAAGAVARKLLSTYCGKSKCALIITSSTQWMRC